MRKTAEKLQNFSRTSLGKIQENIKKREGQSKKQQEFSFLSENVKSGILEQNFWWKYKPCAGVGDTYCK